MDVYCFHCGQLIDQPGFPSPTAPAEAVAVIAVESHTGRLGTARIHNNCLQPTLSRYRQTVEWDGSTIGNLSAFKRLYRRLADHNGAGWGAVRVVLTGRQ
jgi:hypothetical protein